MNHSSTTIKPKQPATENPLGRADGLRPSNDTQRPWVLCIDDDEDFTHALKLRLQTHGFDVVRASRGNDGYQFAFEFEPVAVLLDLNLPGESGEELLSQLRFHPETAHIPVMIVTGMNEPGLDRRLLSKGAHAFFRKPVSFPTLMEAVVSL